MNSGEWRSDATNKEFQISQTGREFTLKFNNEPFGSGKIIGNLPSNIKITLTWFRGPYSGRTVKGEVRKIDGNRITKIEFPEDRRSLHRID